jgi:hypothetical protein
MPYKDRELGRAKARQRYAEDAAYRQACVEAARERNKAVTTEQKSKYRKAARERFKALGLTREGKAPIKPWRHDAHVAIWRKQPKPPSPQLHDAHVREFKSDRSRVWTWRYRNDPVFNAAQKLRQYNRKANSADRDIAGRIAVELKQGRFRFGAMTGYTFDELWARLLQTMPSDASIADFMHGRLHIDHIKPRAAFNLADHSQLTSCWALDNLQLLWAADNQKKWRHINWKTHGFLLRRAAFG